MQIVLNTSLQESGVAAANRPLTIVAAPGGSGKTSLIRRWHENFEGTGARAAWLTLDALHSDPNVFVEDVVEAIRDGLPEPLEGAEAFGTALLRALPRNGEILAAPIARLLEREFKALAGPVVLFLDAFEHLEAESVTTQIVDRLVRNESTSLRLVITTRGLRPDASTRLLASGDALEIGPAALALGREQIESVLRHVQVELEPKQIEQLVERTAGWAIAVRYAARALSTVDVSDRGRFIDELVREPDLFRYIARELVEGIPPDITEALEVASLIGRVDRSMLVAAIGEPNAARRVDEANRLGLLLRDGEEVQVHELLSSWLRLRAKERLDAPAWSDLLARLGQILEERGRGMAALRVYRDGALHDATAALLSRQGHSWVNRGQYDLASEALSELPEAIRSSNPELIALAGVIEGGRDPETAIDNLRRATEMYRKAGNREAEFETLHELAIVAINENRTDEIVQLVRYTLTLRRVILEPRLRGMFVLAMADAAFITGRYNVALRMLRLADTYEHEPRENAGLGLARSTMNFYRGDWDEVIADVDERCADESQRRHGPGFFAMQTRRCAVLGLRGIDLDGCRQTLDDASRMFATARHSLNRLQSEFAYAQIAARQGDQATAIQRFEIALALAQRIELAETEAAVSGHLARCFQRTGDRERAVAQARSSLEIFERPESWTKRFSAAPLSAPGACLGALVYAELADPKEALRAIDRKRKRLAHRELPLGAFTIGVCRSRIAELAGQPKRAKTELVSAWRAHREASLADAGPEVDSDLLRWAIASAQNAKLDTGLLRTEQGVDPTERLAPIQIQSLGGIGAAIDGKEVSNRNWRGSTPRRLLARLLAAEGRPVARERVEFDLWPDATPANARNNLRVALSKLRDVLEPRRKRGERSRYIQVEGERISLSREAMAGSDVFEWQNALSTLAEAAEDGQASGAEQAVEILRRVAQGPFAPDFLEDWSLDYRRHLDERGLRTGRHAVECLIDQGLTTLAASTAEWLVSAYRDDEIAWELLATARIEAGDRTGALRAISDARAAIEAQLGLDVGPGLQQIESRVRAASR